MRVEAAMEVARRWVLAHAVEHPGFAGAYFSGSITWFAAGDGMPVGTDVDVMVVLTGDAAPPKLGKFEYDGALLEVTYVAAETLRSPEVVLGDYHLAPSFRAPFLIADPTGALTELQQAVGPEYARRRWVRARVDDARRRIEHRLGDLDGSQPFAGQVLAWLFPTGVTTHLLLVAGLRNPTIRRRYVAVHDLLVEYERLDVYEQLLELLGSAHLSRARVELHLAALARLFDVVAPLAPATPYFFASDLGEVARPIAVDGSRALIDQGHHRAAMFWILATASRAHQALQYAQVDLDHLPLEAEYRALLEDVGIVNAADLRSRADATLAMLPELSSVAEQIIAVSPAIRE